MKAAVLPVPVWAMPSRSRPSSSGRDRLRLDGRWRVVVLGGERLEGELREPEVFEGHSKVSLKCGVQRAAVTARGDAEG